MNSIERRLVNQQQTEPELLPRFEALRSDSPHYQSDTEDETKFKITVPIKRINKKLSDILTEVQMNSEQLKGSIADFRLIFAEHSQEQAIILQNFAKNFASIEQICGEHSREFSRFVTK